MQFKVIAILTAVFVATSALFYIASFTPIFSTPTRRIPFTLSCSNSGNGVRGGSRNSSVDPAPRSALDATVRPPPAPPAVVPSSPPRPAVSAKSNRDPWLTAQACSLLADESELCDYKGPVCLALSPGGDATVYVSHSQREMEFDPRDWCYDARGKWLYVTLL